MKLYLVRHGIAVDIGEEGVVYDQDRMLTDEGRQKTRRIAHGLAILEIKPQMLLSSPYVRARETAEIMAEVLKPPDGVLETPALEPDGSLEELYDLIDELDKPSAMLVGHNPFLGELASDLLVAESETFVLFKKAAVCCVETSGKVGPGCAMLNWHLQPRQLLGLLLSGNQ